MGNYLTRRPGFHATNLFLQNVHRGSDQHSELTERYRLVRTKLIELFFIPKLEISMRYILRGVDFGDIYLCSYLPFYCILLATFENFKSSKFFATSSILISKCFDYLTGIQICNSNSIKIMNKPNFPPTFLYDSTAYVFAIKKNFSNF